MSSGNDTDKDSSSQKGSLPSKLDIDSQEDKKSPSTPPPPKSEKDSDEDDSPTPTSNDSDSSSKTPPSPSQATPPQSSSPSPEESPSKKLPPAPPPPPPPTIAPPPPPPVNSAHDPRVTPPPHSPLSRSPASSSPSHPRPSSSPPPPSPSDGENSSPNPLKHSPSSPNSQDPSSSKNSSNNSPPPPPDSQDPSSSKNSSNNSPLTHTAPPPQTAVEEGIQPGPNYPSSLNSPGLPAGSNTSRGFSNDSTPSTSEGNGGGGGNHVNPGEYVGIAFASLCLIFFVVLCLLVAEIRKRKRGAVHDVTYTSSNMKADGHYCGPQPLQDDQYKNGSQRGSVNPLGTSESVQPTNAQTVFSYESVVEITNGFSSQNIIGEGGFGCVYKGWLSDGRAVAVKKLKADSGQGDREFRAEVEIISRVHHRHLVSLVGYCISEQQKILMYEFVPNGTLDQHLHGKGMPVLDWTKRVKIAIGAAKGLAYLHEDCHPKIIHRDIKSANILLDDAYVAQVSDFGLARLTDDANTHVSTRVMGTFGYMAPEYATSGKLTDRSDVFSFGVVLLELLTGRKPVDQTQPLGEESLVEWARSHLIHAIETGDFSKLIDTRLENHFVENEVLRMIEAAAACVRHSAPKRPRMLQVVRALDNGGELIDLSNGVKYGQSIAYDSGQYDEEIMRFRMMNGVSESSEFDLHSEEYSTGELSGIQCAWAQGCSGGETGSRAFSNGDNSRQTKEYC